MAIKTLYKKRLFMKDIKKYLVLLGVDIRRNAGPVRLGRRSSENCKKVLSFNRLFLQVCQRILTVLRQTIQLIKEEGGRDQSELSGRETHL